MADNSGYFSEGSSPLTTATGRSWSLNFLDLDGFFERSMHMEEAKVPVHRALSRVVSNAQLEITERDGGAASPASPASSVRNFLSRTSSTAAGDTWWRECELPVARKLRHRSRREAITRVHSATAALPDWPEVEEHVFASSKRHLLSFTLDPTTLTPDVLCHLAMEMFVSAGLPAGLAEHRVRRFILAVRASMLDNPYHNFNHVFDVMQTTNALATSTGTMARLDAWERFGLLSAALCHDLEHPGVTSAFLSKQGASAHGYKNLIFRDALLEKHHALRALGVMVDRDIGILDGLSSAQYYQFRSSVSKIILATDISRHNDYLADLNQFAARRAEDPAVEMENQMAMELMVKCADISNVIKPTKVARRWALRVTDEFFNQGDAERSMGMEVSATCDRLTKSRVGLQTGFIDFLAAPLFTQLAAAFPAARGLDAPLAQLLANRASYELCSDVELELSRDLLLSETESSESPTEVGGAGSRVGSLVSRCDPPPPETHESPHPLELPLVVGAETSPSRVEWFMAARGLSGLDVASEEHRSDPLPSETQAGVSGVYRSRFEPEDVEWCMVAQGWSELEVGEH